VSVEFTDSTPLTETDRGAKELYWVGGVGGGGSHCMAFESRVVPPLSRLNYISENDHSKWPELWTNHTEDQW